MLGFILGLSFRIMSGLGFGLVWFELGIKFRVSLGLGLYNNNNRFSISFGIHDY